MRGDDDIGHTIVEAPQQRSVGHRLLDRVRPSKAGTMALDTAFVFEPHGCAGRSDRDLIDFDPDGLEDTPTLQLEAEMGEKSVALFGELTTLDARGRLKGRCRGRGTSIRTCALGGRIVALEW